MTDLLKAGKKIGSNELVTLLGLPKKLIPAWKAVGTDGKEYVLRFLSTYAYAGAMPTGDFEIIKALPRIQGFVPWLDWEMVQLDIRQNVLALRRPYFRQRLTDQFPADATHRPSKALLGAFEQLAQTFDMLQTHLPNFNFDLAPGNLLWDGDTPLLVDCGLAKYALNMEMDFRMPFSNMVEHERGVPLLAGYASLWYLGQETKSAPKDKIRRTNAQYALAALYVYFRTRYLVFEDPANPYPQTGDVSRADSLEAKFNWMSKQETIVQDYEENGTLKLPMLIDENERELVARALARDESTQYENCVAFVTALQALYSYM